MATQSEETVVFQVRQGDKGAFQEVYIGYQAALLATITGIVPDPDEAADVLQDTYLKVWQRFHLYDPERGSLFTWLLTIARHTALDSVRRRKLICTTLDTDTVTMSMGVTYQPGTDTVGVRHTVSQLLRPKQWQVIDLRYWQGYTTSEIAELLILPVATVKSRIHKSLIRLRPFFDRSC